MRSSSTPMTEATRPLLMLLLWPVLAALLFGLTGFGEPLEDTLRVARNNLRQHAVSGDIVLVEVDDASLRSVGSWPWPRAKHGELIDRLNQLGAKKIFVDILYGGESTPAHDRALAESLRRAGNVTIAIQSRIGEHDGRQQTVLPLPAFAQHSQLAGISLQYNWQNVVWRLPRGASAAGRTLPSLSAAIAGKPGDPGAFYTVDYGLDVDSVPRISASDLLGGKVSADRIAGKTMVYGTTAPRLGDQYFIPGRSKNGGVLIHILGAETLRAGTPVDLGWVPALLLACLVSVIALTFGKRSHLGLTLGATAIILMLLPIALEAGLVTANITPALFLILVLGGRLLWQRSRSRGLINALSGLPNLAALAVYRPGRDLPLVAVRVHNYAEIASTLPAAAERQMVEQIVARLTLGHQNRQIYQGDEGIFAWFAEAGTPFAAHLDALHALFRSPVRIGDTMLDVALSFGVELGSSRSVHNRLGSALVAADEADAESLKWKYHDPARLEDVPWRLSLLSQLDAAIDKGEVWLAYQPKVDLKTRRIIGAEALARWTHPEKGPISPTEFVTAAEHSDRIERLTDFVIDRAVESAAKINASGIEFGIAVNLSARMLSDSRLPDRVMATLRRYDLKPERLTLELTETAAISGSGTGIEMLARLRDLGIKIAIDDYGTGLSTLEYLKKMPASEIKIDQSFVKAMRDNRSDLIMVQSTIALAHSLGRTVVAEGVEDPHSLEQLTMMKCDVAQGFVLGRPMSFEEIVRRLLSEKSRRAA